MKFRESEYQKIGIQGRWLLPDHAAHAYAYALQFSSNKRYGLNENTVLRVERLIIESRSVADAWLKARFPSTGTIQIVYSENEVCVVDASDFLGKWQEIFVPSRDDAIVLHNLDKTVMFYCHEEELEIGARDV